MVGLCAQRGMGVYVEGLVELRIAGLEDPKGQAALGRYHFVVRLQSWKPHSSSLKVAQHKSGKATTQKWIQCTCTDERMTR